MRKMLFLAVILSAFYAQSLYAATCGSLTNVMNNSSSYWAMPTSYALSNQANITAAPAFCKQTAGETYCGYAVTTMPCQQIISANVSSMTSTGSYVDKWCCVNQATYNLITGSSSGGGDTTTKTYIVLECPTSDMSSCAQGCTALMPQFFGTQMATSSSNQAAVVLCSDLEVSTSATYCCLSKDLVDSDSPLSLYCPLNMITPDKTKRAFDLTQKTKAAGSTTIIYYEASKPSAAYCICEPDYYGATINRLTTSSGTCTKCPCETTKNGQKCGQTYDPSSPSSITAVLSGSINMSSSTACKIQCSESDGCYDTAGSYIHTGACAYSN